jgi:hypothetical protein
MYHPNHSIELRVFFNYHVNEIVVLEGDSLFVSTTEYFNAVEII